MKTKKQRKSKRQRAGSTHGHGARKKWKGSGHRGGKGMAGTGKRADQKKSLIIKLYGNAYFGKQGITSRRTKKRVNKIINLSDIQRKYSNQSEIRLEDYKVLSSGELSKPLKITAKEFSKEAGEKIKKAGGEAIELKIKNKDISSENKTSENKKQDKKENKEGN